MATELFKSAWKNANTLMESSDFGENVSKHNPITADEANERLNEIVKDKSLKDFLVNFFKNIKNNNK